MSQNKVSFDTPSSIIYERKFDTAIRRTQLTAFFARMTNDTCTDDDKLILDSPMYNNQKILKTSPDCYARILQTTLKMHFTHSSKGKQKNQLPNIIRLIHKNLQFQFGYMQQTNNLPNKPILVSKMKSFLNNIIIPSELINLIELAEWFNNVIEETNVMYSRTNYRLPKEIRHNLLSRKNNMTHPVLKLGVAWSGNLCLIEFEGDQYILPKPYILLIHNKLCDLVSVLVLSMYTAGTNNPIDIVSIVLDFVQELCTLMIKYQDQFFSISKTLEALCVAETLAVVEHWKNDQFLRTLDREMYDEIGFSYYNSNLRTFYTSVDAPTRHELSCLSKLIGHPLVDMVQGTIDIHKKTTEQYEVSIMHIIKTECYIKENYISMAILRDKTWPPHVIPSKAAPIALRMAALYGMDPKNYSIVSKYGETQVSDYMFVDLLPNMKFNKLESAIPYLKDKTISLCRSKVLANYIQNVESKPIKTTWKDTRLLLFFLLNPTALLDHVDFLDRYTNSNDLDELMDYLVLRIVPKEKEHKVNHRGFGCKTYHDRMRGLAQEKSVMQYLDMYCDEQAMTLSELELARNLYAFRRIKQAFTKHRVLYINLDASAWNNHFRRETVDDIMVNTLDKIFNYKIFSKTHLAYQKTFFYVPDETGTYYWDGQSGGIEGQNQDTWVVTYIAQVKAALDSLSLKFFCKCTHCLNIQ